MDVRLNYAVSDTVREREFVETGQAGPFGRDIMLKLETPEQREAWLYLYGMAIRGDLLCTMPHGEKIRVSLSAYPRELYLFDALLSEEEAWAAISKVAAWLKIACAEQREKDAAWKAEQAEQQRRNDEFDRQTKARREAEKEAEQAERNEWTKAHGSAHLKRAYGAGYDCTRLYATERASAEAPGYALDFDHEATWEECCCPSEAALDEEQRMTASGFIAQVVWLTYPAVNDPNGEEDCDFEPCEAVMIKRFLDRYNLFRVV